MDLLLLPATTYQPPPRQARGTVLNTIMEEESQFGGDKGSSSDEGTVIGRPAMLEDKYFVPPTQSRQAPDMDCPPSPMSGTSSASCASNKWQSHPPDFDDLYDATDDETEFSESCPSLSSRPTSFATDTTRFSTSSAGSRNRYPSILIPPTSMWPSVNNPHKSSPVPPTPPPKIPVSPAALSLLPRSVPSLHAPPSLDGSLTSDQISNLSCPVTPDVHALAEGDAWGHQPVRLRAGSEMAEDDDNSSEPMTPDIDIRIEAPEDWSHVIGNFPQIPPTIREESESSSTVPAVSEGSSTKNSPTQTSPSRSDSGVALPLDALATLRHITFDESPDLRSEVSGFDLRDRKMQETQMQEVPNPPTRPKSAGVLTTPASAISQYSFTDLSIPSPAGFFSSLNAGARHTWCEPRSAAPPSSTTAENFYNCPWNETAGIVVEQVVEMNEADTDGPVTAIRIGNGPLTGRTITDAPLTGRSRTFTDGLPTARMIQDAPLTSRSFTDPPLTGQSFVSDGPPTARQIPPTSPTPRDSVTSNIGTIEEIRKIEIVYEYEEAYESELQQMSSSNLDRTSMWLAAQSSYLSALRETNPVNDMETGPVQEKPLSRRERGDSLDSPVKKAVKMLEEAVKAADDSPAPEAVKKDSTYYHGFQHVRNKSRRRDSFTHSSPRFEALQAARTSFMDYHIDQLLGKFELRDPNRPKYSGPFSQVPRELGDPEMTAEQKAFDRVEREQAILAQLSSSIWVVEALKFLNGGKLLPSPASKRLAKAQIPLDSPECVGKNRVRVLDLGGQGSCDWGWYCANDYRNVKTYTVVTKQHVTNPTVKGPPNHRQVSVPCLWKLPFRTGHFDVISARSLHTLLKTDLPLDEYVDEYDLCLKECFRCLKRGGYLEFLLMDSEIVKAGPQGSATSVEFGFNLKTHGYDPAPTKAWLPRLRNAHFVNMKRAWMFLPMGVPTKGSPSVRETPDPLSPNQFSEQKYELVQGPVGSTADVANVSGLFGAWMWEQWMLKLQMEMGRDRERLLEGVGSMVEEGRHCGAGFRCLSGWARKPRAKKSEASNVI